MLGVTVLFTGCSAESSEAGRDAGSTAAEKIIQEEMSGSPAAEEIMQEEMSGIETETSENKVSENASSGVNVPEPMPENTVPKENASEAVQGEAIDKEGIFESKDSIIKIALIDTGITKSAINSEHVLPGWNYCSDSDNTEDTIGHGTSLAGMILGSDKANIPGGTPDAYIVPMVCQEEDSEGNINKAEPEMLARMILDAVSVYECNIISISAGVKQDYDVLREAVEYADEMGTLVIAGAGNEGNQDIYYPGGYESVLCVGSANREMTGRADFSQDNEMVDLLAPGEKIVVTTMKGNPIELSGTSYSVAYITAVVARLWQQNPKNSSHQIVEQLMEHTVLVGEEHLLSLE